jgi:hypothetical protein
MVEPDNLVLEQLRAIREVIGKLVNAMQVEMTATRQHLAANSASNWSNKLRIE